MRRFVFAILLALFTQSLFSATLTEYQFENPDDAEDFRQVIEQMRCLVCQNESLAGSNAELAVDLRNEIYDMMKSGQGKDEIIQFMVARYGDFVLLRPPLKPATYLLWFGPFLLLGLGLLLVMMYFRGWRGQAPFAAAPLSEAEQARVSALIDETDQAKDRP